MAKKSRVSCLDKLSQLDLFGRPISLTHEGRHMFTSKIGALLTVAFGLILLILGASTFAKVIVNDIANVNDASATESVDLVELNPTLLGFKFAFGVSGVD